VSLNLAKPTGVKLNIFTVEEALSKMAKVETLKENIDHDDAIDSLRFGPRKNHLSV
jgi:hypothetical protein